MEVMTRDLSWIVLRGDSRTTHANILTDSVSLLQKSEKCNGNGHLAIFGMHLQRLLWIYRPGHAGVKGTDRAARLGLQSNNHKRLASRKIWSVEELDSLLAGTKPRTAPPSIACRRAGAHIQAAVDDLRWKDEAGPLLIRPTLEQLQRQHWGHFCQTCWGA